jgi:predicted glycoside hydrolase/deacetylase ChbG (UPF0249 family)
MRAVCKAAKERGIRCVRVPIDTPLKGTSLSRSLGAKAINEYAKRSKAIADEYGLWHPDHFMSVAEAGHFTEGKMMDALSTLQHGVTEFACHPGAHTGRLEAVLKWGYEWEAERKALISENVRYKLSAHDITLTTFREADAEASERQARTASAKAKPK